MTNDGNIPDGMTYEGIDRALYGNEVVDEERTGPPGF